MRKYLLLTIFCLSGFFAQCQSKKVMICGLASTSTMPVLNIQFSIDANHSIHIGGKTLQLQKDFDKHLTVFKKALLEEAKTYQKTHKRLPRNIIGRYADNHLMGVRGLYRDVIVEVKKELGIQ